MSDNICIPKSYFFIILIIFSAFTYFHTVRMSKYNNNEDIKLEIKREREERKREKEERKKIKLLKKNQKKTKKVKDESETESQTKIKKVNINSSIVNNNYVDPLSERDIDVVENKFAPPERRLPRHNYPTESLKRLINVPTRGYPDNYQNVGMLVRKNDEKILKLFGRQKFPGSNQWEYYVLSTQGFESNTKIPLKIPGNKELSNNDVIAVPWLDQSKGKFDVKIFDYDAPRYNPHLI